MQSGSIVGAIIATLAGAWGGVVLARMLKSGMAGPYSRQSRPVNYWLRCLRVALFVAVCLTSFVWFLVSK
jgi:hypothetical protein